VNVWREGAALHRLPRGLPAARTRCRAVDQGFTNIQMDFTVPRDPTPFLQRRDIFSYSVTPNFICLVHKIFYGCSMYADHLHIYQQAKVVVESKQRGELSQ
jgi:hypothetical protein